MIHISLRTANNPQTTHLFSNGIRFLSSPATAQSVLRTPALSFSASKHLLLDSCFQSMLSLSKASKHLLLDPCCLILGFETPVTRSLLPVDAVSF